MTYRLRDSTWTIVFKALIITHLMIREGAPDVTLSFIADSPSKMAISNFSDGKWSDSMGKLKTYVLNFSILDIER